MEKVKNVEAKNLISFHKGTVNSTWNKNYVVLLLLLLLFLCIYLFCFSSYYYFCCCCCWNFERGVGDGGDPHTLDPPMVLGAGRLNQHSHRDVC